MLDDNAYMRRAIELAKLGEGYVNPNPLVGAVIVKDNRIISEGYHREYGKLHAERDALSRCTEDCTGATMYVTLEPCCHYGKQPPCTDAIIEAGISRVVVGSGDPNPQVAGKGIEILRNHGIEVTENILAEECKAINSPFLHFIKTGMPLVVSKYAMTLDGKIASSTGHSKWVTGDASRRHVHTLRNKYAAIMVGIGTVLADDPMLNCRLEGGKNPVRVICDTHLRTPITCNIVKTAHGIPTIIATSVSDEAQLEPYRNAGIEIIVLPETESVIDLELLIKKLGEKKLDSVLVEGGGRLHWSLFEKNLVDRVAVYIAPKIIGGADAVSPVEGAGFTTMNEAVIIENRTVTVLGDDILIEGEVIKCSQE